MIDFGMTDRELHCIALAIFFLLLKQIAQFKEWQTKTNKKKSESGLCNYRHDWFDLFELVLLACPFKSWILFALLLITWIQTLLVAFVFLLRK